MASNEDNRQQGVREMRRGRIIVISGPSGVGKGTVCQLLLNNLPNVRLSVSATTREKRPGEEDGVSYFFMDRDRFEQMAEAGDMLEWAEYNQCYYGTPRFYVEEQINTGVDVLLEIETQGALMVKKLFPDDACMIFLKPPSMAILRERLQGRGTNTDSDIDNRMAIAERELGVAGEFHHQVVNDDLNDCYEAVLGILTKAS